MSKHDSYGRSISRIAGFTWKKARGVFSFFNRKTKAGLKVTADWLEKPKVRKAE